ncbi:MAG: hypothetical protein K8T20_05645 [Planctomycetes bacterium]|nr:hypothetical protein [Planctomycetota bacterium]
MNPEALEGNPEAQQRALTEIAERASLTRLLPAVGAYSLGAIPLSRDDDGISMATYPGICPAALALLRRHLGAPIKPIAFDEEVMTFFVKKIYLGDHGVNLHTFRSADFLDNPANDEKVLSVKVESPETGVSALDPGRIALADIHLSSVLRNLDTGQPPRLETWRLGEFRPGFRRDGDRWTIWAANPVPTDAPLFIQYSEEYEGDEFFRDISAEAVREFPFILFASEVQVLGVEASGALVLYVDGATHRIEPGSTPALQAEYWLVRHGHRFHRKLEIRVRGIWVESRDSLNFEPPFRGAGAEELRKWLSL